MSDWHIERDKDRRRQPFNSGNRLFLEVERGGNLDELLRLMVVQISDIGFINAKLDLILGLLEEEDGVIPSINNLNGKVETFMATQEERLQAILTAVQNVKQMLADLKVNNPDIEDEITKIEAELAPAESPTEGGGTV